MAKRSGEVVESPILDMSFDFSDAPPAIVNKSNDNEKSDNKESKEKPKKLSIRKVNPPKPIKKKPVKPVQEDKIERKKLSKSMKRVRNNLRIDMVGYEQKPNYAMRSNPNKRGK
jgi:hypothetical protein